MVSGWGVSWYPDIWVGCRAPYSANDDELATPQAILDNSPSKLEHLVEEGDSLRMPNTTCCNMQSGFAPAGALDFKPVFLWEAF